MSFEEIEKLVDLVSVSNVLELTVETEERRLTVRKGVPPRQSAHAAAPSASQPGIEAEVAGGPEDEPGVGESGGWQITAPMVGYFHAAESPLVVGGRVNEGQVVGAIESMKLMNEIRAERAGIVLEALTDSGHAVEYGQPLFALDDDES